MAIDLRGPQALRSIVGLCNLIRHHSAATIDHACQRAIAAGAYVCGRLLDAGLAAHTVATYTGLVMLIPVALWTLSMQVAKE